ncbi:MAG: hypothetical protein FWC40_00280 [Proteobacteria bacterium]|nr:hypothetical protein [Pseudomonadota bacterium]
MKTLPVTHKKRLILATLGLWMAVCFAFAAPKSAQAHGLPAYIEMHAGVGYLGYFASGNKMQGLTVTLSTGFVLGVLGEGGFGVYLDQNLGGGLKNYDGFIGSTILGLKSFFPVIDDYLILGMQLGIGAAYAAGKSSFDLDKGAFALKAGLGFSIPVADWVAIGADFSYTFCARIGYIGHIITPSLHFRFDLLPP